MHNTMAFKFLLIGSILWTVPAVTPAQERPAKQAGQPKKSSAKEPASLTGCVDEKDGQYVLIHDQTRDLIANLVADGFPTEGFARHLGHKVTVRGTSDPNGAQPVFKVRSVETVSEACGSGKH